MAVKCLLLDIEGTTTSISFVKDELFPYVRKKLKTYLETNWNSSEVQEDISLLRKQVIEDKSNGMVEVPEIANNDLNSDLIIESVIANVNWQMAQDRKITALKQLQGHIWRDGYCTGGIFGHVYDDVKEALELWTSSGRKVYIYSSGSEEAQKLLFGHSIVGNLLQFISGHFDTNVGLKVHKSSYSAICKLIGVVPSEVLFLTDIQGEAIAASEAGLQVSVMVRPGNAPLSEDVQQRFTTYESFNDVKLK